LAVPIWKISYVEGNRFDAKRQNQATNLCGFRASLGIDFDASVVGVSTWMLPTADEVPEAEVRQLR
jgi:hypothetical protein